MANRYWVGGSGTWNTTSTANWSASSGGASGASAPTAADAVLFDAASGAVTATLGENVSVLTLNMTGFTGTLNFATSQINIVGTGTPFTQSTTMTVAGTPVINLTNNTSSSRTLSISNIIEANAISYNVTAGTGVLAITNLSGIKNLDFTGFSGSWQNNSANIFGNLIISTEMTASAGPSTRVFAGTSGIQQITTNGKTLDFPISLNGVGGIIQLQDNLTIGSTRTYTLTNGSLDLNDKTLTAGALSSNNTNIRSIAFGSSGKIVVTLNATTIINLTNTTNFTFSGTSNIVSDYSGSTGTRTINIAQSGFTSANRLNLTILNGSDTVSLVAGIKIRNLVFTNFTGTLANQVRYLSGDLVLSAGMTVASGANLTVFEDSSGTQSLTTNAVVINNPIQKLGAASTLECQDALTLGSPYDFNIGGGTLKLKSGTTSTVYGFGTIGSGQKFLQSTTPGSQATLSQASGTVNVSNLSVQDINATGGATWNLVNGSINYGNLTGWYVAHQQNAHLPGGFF